MGAPNKPPNKQKEKICTNCHRPYLKAKFKKKGGSLIAVCPFCGMELT